MNIEAIPDSRCILSVVGDHAGEPIDSIFARKQKDIPRAGVTYWLHRSRKATPEKISSFCTTRTLPILFLSPSAPGRVIPTTTSSVATQQSILGLFWHPLPENLGPVTGKLDARSYALIMDHLDLQQDLFVDLWSWSEGPQPVQFMQGASTLCAERGKVQGIRPRSRYRKVVAIGRLASPYCVYVR